MNWHRSAGEKKEKEEERDPTELRSDNGLKEVRIVKSERAVPTTASTLSFESLNITPAAFAADNLKR
jgi:hypothetical protein